MADDTKIETVYDHGLPRRRSKVIDLIIRKRCKFSCVICADGLVEYHHFDPPYAEAESHDPEGITLLCGSCHNRVTREHLTNLEVAEADARRRNENPTANFLMSFRRPTLTVVGSVILLGVDQLLSIHGIPILGVVANDTGVALSGTIFDSEGQRILEIEDNVLRFRAENWDVDVKKALITVRSGRGKIALELKLHPPSGIHLRRLNMAYGRWKFKTSADGRIRLLQDGAPPPDGSIGRTGLNFDSGTVMVAGGSMNLNDGFEIGPGLCVDPSYPGKRFSKLSRMGHFDKIVSRGARAPDYPRPMGE